MSYANDHEYDNKLLIYALTRIEEHVDFTDIPRVILHRFIDLDLEELPKDMPYLNKHVLGQSCRIYYRIIICSFMFNWLSFQSKRRIFDLSHKIKKLFENTKLRETTISKIKEFEKDPASKNCKYWKGEDYYLEKIFN